MSKQTEALKLALEALEYISSHYMSLPKIGCMALAAVEEALAEQETVLPGGGHVPAVPVAVYGYCPECGGAGVMRERRPNGDDKCTNGHKYPSSKALAEQPAQQQEPVAWRWTESNGRHWFDWRTDWTHHDRAKAMGFAIEYAYTSPPASKPWVGLTEEQKAELVFELFNDGKAASKAMYLLTAHEAKLREKNA